MVDDSVEDEFNTVTETVQEIVNYDYGINEEEDRSSSGISNK